MLLRLGVQVDSLLAGLVLLICDVSPFSPVLPGVCLPSPGKSAPYCLVAVCLLPSAPHCLVAVSPCLYVCIVLPFAREGLRLVGACSWLGSCAGSGRVPRVPLLVWLPSGFGDRLGWLSRLSLVPLFVWLLSREACMPFVSGFVEWVACSLVGFPVLSRLSVPGRACVGVSVAADVHLPVATGLGVVGVCLSVAIYVVHLWACLPVTEGTVGKEMLALCWACLPGSLFVSPWSGHAGS